MGKDGGGGTSSGYSDDVKYVYIDTSTKENNITPIELLRKLFNISKEVDDYQMITFIYEQATKDRIVAQQLSDLYLPKYVIAKNNG